MGLSHSAASAILPGSESSQTTRRVHPNSKASLQIRSDYDKLFADMEFRSKRAAMMNYHEAERFDKWTRTMQKVSNVVGALAVSGIGASVAKTKKVAASSAGLAGMLALPLCGVLQFFSNGSSTMAPTLAEKAKIHTRAGAGWQKITRVCKDYRVQLKHLADESLEAATLSAWYREVVEACEEVSKLVPIRADTYHRFEKAEPVTDRINKRETLVKEYMDSQPVLFKGQR